MFPLGHAGVTLAGWRAARARWGNVLGGPAPWLLAGALLPDAVDKPLGLLFLPLENGRIVGHTLAFALGLAAAGALAGRRGRPEAAALRALAVGSGAHLLLDRMFLDPRTLLWPLGGWRFPSRSFEVVQWREALLDPATLVPEILGGLYLVWEGVRWIRGRGPPTPGADPG